ncbi:MAG: lytic transglycosylase domain-containing protein, partial [Clostridia bacterium]|nr:lytic transglycosylase domain-containing protein [Clostridia bacterium]
SIFLIFLLNIFIFPFKYKKQINYYSKAYNVKQELVFAIIKAESNFNENAKSSKGAVGLMQILPSTAKWIALKIGQDEYDLFDVNINIKFGTYYLNYLIKKFKYEDVAICSYNAGEGIVKSWLNCEDYSDDQKQLKIIPYAETRNYLKKVNYYKSIYKSRLG